MSPLQNKELLKGKEVPRVSPNQHKVSSGKEVARMSPHQNTEIAKGTEVPRMSPNRHKDRSGKELPKNGSYPKRRKSERKGGTENIS